MKYTIAPWVFEKLPKVEFGVIVAKGIENGPTSEEDSRRLSASEAQVRQKISSDQLKSHSDVARYRTALQDIGINPNKYMNSVEAMTKRIVKGSDLPRINALVDLCNAVALEHMVSLGAHDLEDIDKDLEVRLSVEGDVFLPFASESFEEVPAGELVFTSGEKIQTRQWLWRQSELGKITHKSQDIFFQLVGFADEHHQSFMAAMDGVEALLKERFGGQYQVFIVNKDNPSIDF